jgi:Tfp pilus assembly protein PilO
MKDKGVQKIYLNILMAVLTAVVLITTWKVVAPGYAQEKSRKLELENEIGLAKQRLDWLDASKTELLKNKDLLDQLFVAVPKDSDAPNLISELEAIAIKNSLVIPSIGISDGESAEGESATASASNLLAITLSVNGNFENINNFLASLEKSVKYMNVTSLTYSNSVESGTSISLEIEAYEQVSQSSGPDEASQDEAI